MTKEAFWKNVFYAPKRVYYAGEGKVDTDIIFREASIDLARKYIERSNSKKRNLSIIKKIAISFGFRLV